MIATWCGAPRIGREAIRSSRRVSTTKIRLAPWSVTQASRPSGVNARWWDSRASSILPCRRPRRSKTWTGPDQSVTQTRLSGAPDEVDPARGLVGHDEEVTGGLDVVRSSAQLEKTHPGSTDEGEAVAGVECDRRGSVVGDGDVVRTAGRVVTGEHGARGEVDENELVGVLHTYPDERPELSLPCRWVDILARIALLRLPDPPVRVGLTAGLVILLSLLFARFAPAAA